MEREAAIEQADKRVEEFRVVAAGARAEAEAARRGAAAAVEVAAEEARSALERKNRLITALREQLAAAEDAERRWREELEALRAELTADGLTSATSHDDSAFD